MKKPIIFSVLIFCGLLIGPYSSQCGQNVKDIDPCSLIAAEKLYTAFPNLKKMEKTKTGPLTMCSYLNKYEIPALITSVTKAPAHVSDSLSVLGSRYTIEEIQGLGDEAAIAIQQPTPKYGIKAGIAALHIIKGKKALNFSFFGLDLLPGDPGFEQIKLLAAEMLEKL